MPAKAASLKPRAPKSKNAEKAAAPAFSRDLELEAIADSCTRFLGGHGPSQADDLLGTIPAGTAKDYYGVGGVVAELQDEIAKLLGKQAALFVLTGTMAQQATLRVLTDRRASRSIAFHPACHLESHEERGYQRLHGLAGIPVGSRHEPLTAASLAKVREPVGALLLELPQRDLGGTLPDWNELVAQVTWGRDRGAAVHLDGARLWEASPFYKKAHRKSPADIAALFDTVYVSFYKGLGGIAGCCVAGDADVIEELAVWRIRHGGRAFGMWPYAASALTVLRRRLPLMAKYHAHAVAIGQALDAIAGVEVLPFPVQASMLHFRARVEPDELRARVIEIAKADGIFTIPRAFVVEGGNLCRFELSVGDATLQLTPAEIGAAIERLVGQR